MDDIVDELEEDRWYRGPIKWIIGLFLLMILILTVVPAYTIKVDPNPTNIPEINEVFNGTSSQTNFSINQLADYYNYVITDGEVKKVADKILSKTCQNNKVCNAKALYYFVRDNVNYVNDPLKFEFIKEPAYTLEVESGDCDDHAILLASLLRNVGFQTRFVFIPRHVYIQVYLPEALARYKNGEWVNLDSTCKSCDFGEIPPSKEQKQYI